LVFERKILRTIFGPTKERYGKWKMKTNNELNKLIKNRTIIKYIKPQRLRWLGYVYRKPDERMVKKGLYFGLKYRNSLRHLKLSKHVFTNYLNRILLLSYP
jgi:hypothetical protein